jgi:uncharacterized protein YigE (DUF2233 family)
MMAGNRLFKIDTFLILSVFFLLALTPDQISGSDKIVSYIVDINSQEIKFYWKNDSGKPYKSILNLKNRLEKKNETLLFAMNGGMYKEDNSPLGLYIEDGKVLSRLNTADASGNFYLKPNGIFYITQNKKAVICQTSEFSKKAKIKYATQSGPMLVINGQIHSAFEEGSANLNIRNGVGILPDGKVIFAISKEPINFYDFAKYFQDLGCKNALYLDGFVSRMYLPEKNWLQTDGNFGAIIGVTQP